MSKNINEEPQDMLNLEEEYNYLRRNTASLLKRPSKYLTLCMLSSFCLFDLILYVPSTIFQLNRDGSSWVEPVLS